MNNNEASLNIDGVDFSDVLLQGDSDESAGVDADADDTSEPGCFLGNRSKSVVISHSWMDGVRLLRMLKEWWNPNFCNAAACRSPSLLFSEFCQLSKKTVAVDETLEKAAKTFRGLECTLHSVLSEARVAGITIWNDPLDTLALDIICTYDLCCRIAFLSNGSNDLPTALDPSIFQGENGGGTLGIVFGEIKNRLDGMGDDAHALMQDDKSKAVSVYRSHWGQGKAIVCGRTWAYAWYLMLSLVPVGHDLICTVFEDFFVRMDNDTDKGNEVIGDVYKEFHLSLVLCFGRVVNSGVSCCIRSKRFVWYCLSPSLVWYSKSGLYSFHDRRATCEVLSRKV